MAAELKPTNGKRGPKGHRLGAWHQHAKADDETVIAARLLREEQGLTYVEIGARLNVHWRTVCDWVKYSTRASA